MVALRLDQIHDWAARTLRLFRLQALRQYLQVYPLVPHVAEGLARYIDLVRPPCPWPQVFLCMPAAAPTDEGQQHL